MQYLVVLTRSVLELEFTFTRDDTSYFNCLWSAMLLSRDTTNPTKWHVRLANTQISLGIRSFWSESSLCAQLESTDLPFWWLRRVAAQYDIRFVTDRFKVMFFETEYNNSKREFRNRHLSLVLDMYYCG